MAGISLCRGAADIDTYPLERYVFICIGGYA